MVVNAAVWVRVIGYSKLFREASRYRPMIRAHRANRRHQPDTDTRHLTYLSMAVFLRLFLPFHSAEERGFRCIVRIVAGGNGIRGRHQQHALGVWR